MGSGHVPVILGEQHSKIPIGISSCGSLLGLLIIPLVPSMS
jgi:hypothetical protein